MKPPSRPRRPPALRGVPQTAAARPRKVAPAAPQAAAPLKGAAPVGGANGTGPQGVGGSDRKAGTAEAVGVERAPAGGGSPPGGGSGTASSGGGGAGGAQKAAEHDHLLDLGKSHRHRQRNRQPGRRNGHRRHSRRNRRHPGDRRNRRTASPGPESPVGNTVDETVGAVEGVARRQIVPAQSSVPPTQHLIVKMPVRWRSEDRQGSVASDPIAGSAVFPQGSRVNARRAPRGRRLRRGRAGRRARHPRLLLRRGRHPRPRPRLPRGVRVAAASISRSSSPASRCPAPPPTGSSPRRASRSTSPPAASCTWRCRPASTPTASTCTATTSPTRRSSSPPAPASAT